ncbi:MAG: protein-L-isoaspartate O-methyltransferase family protein [Acidibrevibacterium sp.]|uniref:protein-L-isoaspartate O-methyltransferase family protein n=1 Tax=Acidibrevibacterium sp. TaxID=2606776 RepID=UPI003D0045F3
MNPTLNLQPAACRPFAGILENFAREIDATVRANGLADGLRAGLRAAILDCPRHFFVQRYIAQAGGNVHDLASGSAEAHFGAIYRDIPLGYVDAAGQPMASTNSQPSIVLHLLELLDLQPGQRVLEIGSGGGWMLGLIARAVGPTGEAVGVEIIPALAAQSRQSLAAAGITNARVHAADGQAALSGLGQFDRIIFTTGLFELPAPFFDAVVPGGLLLAPFQIKGLGNDVLLLRRTEAGGFRAEASLACCFIYPTGALACADYAPRALAETPLWQEVALREVVRLPMPLGRTRYATTPFSLATIPLRSFLTKIEPRFTVFGPGGMGVGGAGEGVNPQIAGAAGGSFDVAGIGLLDEAAGSLALCNGAELIGFGTTAAADALLGAYHEWARCLMPGIEAFEATLWRKAEAPAGAVWAEPRGETVFHWSQKRGWPRLAPSRG